MLADVSLKAPLVSTLERWRASALERWRPFFLPFFPIPMPDTATAAPVRRFRESGAGFRWAETPLKEYKPDGGTHFRAITRQVLFGEEAGLPAELRYFEIEAGGYSTLERHRHVHAVLVLRGRGRVLVGGAVYGIGAFDAVHVPPETWHQFRADEDEPLGFLCLVDCQRDRPHRPTADEAAALQAHPEIGDFVRL